MPRRVLSAPRGSVPAMSSQPDLGGARTKLGAAWPGPFAAAVAVVEQVDGGSWLSWELKKGFTMPWSLLGCVCFDRVHYS